LLAALENMGFKDLRAMSRGLSLNQDHTRITSTSRPWVTITKTGIMSWWSVLSGLRCRRILDLWRY
jgi:hypothetical protein